MTTGTNPPQPQPWPPPQRDKPRSGIRNALTGRWAFLAIGFIVGAIIGSSSGGGGATSTSPGLQGAQTVTVTAAAPEPGQTQAQEPTGVPGDGVSLVGADITPGTYRATGDRCYWARLSGTSGEFSDIIANSNGPGVVTIAATDKAFESRRCQWTKV